MGTLTVSIDRTSLSLDPLVLSGSEDGTTWGIVSDTFQMPMKQARIAYVDSPFQHGSTAVGWSWQQGLISFDASPEVASEVALANALAELEAALGRLSYEVTTTVNGQADVWRCDPGSLASEGRGLIDLDDHAPAYTVTIPCYPVAS